MLGRDFPEHFAGDLFGALRQREEDEGALALSSGLAKEGGKQEVWLAVT